MRVIVAVLMVILSATSLFAQEAEEMAREFFLDYVENLKQGDYLVAADKWSIWDRTYAEYLGIDYSDCPLKLECGTLLGRNLERLQSGEATVEIVDIVVSRGFARTSFRISGVDSLGVAYVNIEAPQDLQIVTPLFVFAGNWEELPSDYFKLTYRDQTLVQTENLDLANQFILEMASRLHFSDKEIALLQDRKLNLYLCESHGEVEQLTNGAGTWGYYQPCDAVVSRFLPDRAQIAQLMLSMKILQLPPATAPLLRYGTSTYLGGGYSRSASLALSLGRYIYLNDFSNLEDLMSTEKFLGLESNPDFAYPVAGLFCAYLFENLNFENFLTVYLALSGDFEEIENLEAPEFKKRLTGALAKDWPTIESEFRSFAEAWQYDDLAAGGSTTGELVYESGVPGAVVRVYDDSAYYVFEVDSDSADFSVAILTSRPGQVSRYESFLFEEQFPTVEYGQERLGVLLTPVEVGCYDYFTNDITGKYIVGLTDDTPLTAGENLYRCRVKKELLPRFERSLKKIFSTR